MVRRWPLAIAVFLVVAVAASCASPTRVTVAMRDHVFEPREFVLQAGDVVFELVNTGAEPHDLSIAQATGVLVAKSERIEAGNKGVLSVKLEPGRYQVYCSIAPHRERGMEGTLTVR